MIEMPLGKVISSVLSIFKMIKEDNEKIYSIHIAELNALVKESHAYYMDSFKEVLKRLKAQESSSDVIQILKELQSNHLSRKVEIQSLSVAIKDAYDGSTLLEKRQLLLLDYVNSIMDYFVSGTTIGGASWFTDFINFSELRQNKNHNEPWATTPFGNDPVRDLVEQAECIIYELLPMRYEEYCKSHSQLKVYLNK